MFSFSTSLKIFLGVEPTDMRKSFGGLFALVRNQLKRDPLDGAVYIFANKRRTLVKILYWDGTGIWVLSKRHAPQCPDWAFGSIAVSISSPIRKGDGCHRLDWRQPRPRLRSSA